MISTALDNDIATTECLRRAIVEDAVHLALYDDAIVNTGGAVHNGGMSRPYIDDADGRARTRREILLEGVVAVGLDIMAIGVVVGVVLVVPGCVYGKASVALLLDLYWDGLIPDGVAVGVVSADVTLDRGKGGRRHGEGIFGVGR